MLAENDSRKTAITVQMNTEYFTFGLYYVSIEVIKYNA